MKYLTCIMLALFAGLLAFTPTFAQKHSCCDMSANARFAMLGQDPAFAGAHASPLPIHFRPHGGKMVSFPCADGKNASAFEVRSGQSNQYLVVIHEWWGLNDHIRKMTEQLFHEIPNTNVIAIDLYDGSQATTAEEASGLMQAADETRLHAIINGLLEYMGEQSTVQTIGWCFGGTWSLQTALMAGKRTAGCVMYYGAPETDAKKLSGLNGPLLGIFATKDQWITSGKVDAFEKELKRLKMDYSIKRFDADHAFANPSNPQYHKEYTEQAHLAAIGFIRKQFLESSK